MHTVSSLLNLSIELSSARSFLLSLCIEEASHMFGAQVVENKNYLLG